MKLYFAPGVCSLTPHIVLCELGLPYELVKVDLPTHKTADGQDFYSINAKGYVPALQLDNGEVLSEVSAIVQYLADQKPEAGLLPPAGSLERARVQEWLSFISTEMHKSFGALFNPTINDEGKATIMANIERRFAYADQALKGRDYLVGSSFTVADAYLLNVINWTSFVQMDLSRWPVLAAYQQRLMARPGVQAAMRDEGLM